MPRYRGTCGCYNRQDARELGLAPAIVWNDMLDRSEHFNINPMWYDQKDAAERLGIPERSMNRAVERLVEAGRIEKKKGYRPGTTTSTTWVTIIEEESVGGSRNDDLAVPRNDDLAVPILKETKENDTDTIGISNVKASSEETIRMKPEVLYTRTKSIFKQRKDIDRKQCVEGIRKLQERLEDEDILAFASYCATEARSKPLVGDDGREWHPTFFWFTDPNKTDKVVNMFKSTPQLYEEKKKLKW